MAQTPIQTPAELFRRLREGHCPAVIYLYGEEEFLLEQCLERLEETLIAPQDRDFNLNLHYGREVKARALVDTLLTYPVFAQRRLVILRDAQHLNAADLDILGAYVDKPAAESVLLCTADKIDGRRKLFQTIKKKHALIEFKPLYENKIPGFVREQLRGLGFDMTEQAMVLFCRRSGTNLREINAELIKLGAYLGKGDLADVADVEAVVSDTRADSVFALTDAIGGRNRSASIRLLNRMLDEGEAALKILTMIVRHYRQLWMVGELTAQRASRGDIAKHLRINPFFLDGLLAQAGRLDRRDCRRAFELFIETDLALKSSGANPRALMEQLVLRLLPEV